MVAVQVMGNDGGSLAASQGNFELNVFMPVCIYNSPVRAVATDCIRLLTTTAPWVSRATGRSAATTCTTPLMRSPPQPLHWRDNAAKTAKKAHAEYISFKEACVSPGFLTAELVRRGVPPEEMV